MKEDARYSQGFAMKLGAIGVIAAALFISAPYAHAESPDILVGQDLTIGSTGQGVVVLQSLLQELGYMTIPTGIPMGYYGPLTKRGVARYQAALGVSPAAGYFGPLTKVAMHQQFASKGWLTLLGW
jgi:peptidoglycan hydrolase-like protein with peptidoglycan-binding domain